MLSHACVQLPCLLQSQLPLLFCADAEMFLKSEPWFFAHWDLQTVILDAHEQRETVLIQGWQPPASVYQPLGRLLLSLGLSVFLYTEIPFLRLRQVHPCREVVDSLMLSLGLSALIYYLCPNVMLGHNQEDGARTAGRFLEYL